MEDNWIVFAAIAGYVLYQIASFGSKRNQKKAFPVPPPKPEFNVPDFRPKPVEPEPIVIKAAEEEKLKKKKKLKTQPQKPPSTTMGELLDEFTRYQPKKALGDDDDSVIKYEGRHSILTEKDFESMERDKRYSLNTVHASRYAEMLGDLDAIRDAFIINELLNRKNWDEEI
jgi:hypothetical protein